MNKVKYKNNDDHVLEIQNQLLETRFCHATGGCVCGGGNPGLEMAEAKESKSIGSLCTDYYIVLVSVGCDGHPG